MSVIQVGIADRTRQIDPELLQETAAALAIQVTRDLGPVWNVQATVRALPSATHIPVGVWPVFLVASLPPGEGGFHLDKKNQPFAEVIATPDSNDWTIDASHEILEMLVDPMGNRLQTSLAIKISGNGVKDTTGDFEYLVEACDPCEANDFAYEIQGIAVSDFITPRFYDPVATSGTRYSFGGNIKAPRQILPGGYISFVDPETDHMEQILLLGPKPQFKDLGPATGSSLRAFVDGQTYQPVLENRKPNTALSERCAEHRRKRAAAANARGALYTRLASASAGSTT
ncbi:MAG TPA: hypothetical protein VMH81_00315 [Bryobacteraceae bacterium]|nr:hypothetical protein [Bryobacteraceae bacterium]